MRGKQRAGDSAMGESRHAPSARPSGRQAASAKAFPTLSSMPRVPRPTQDTPDNAYDRSSTARRRAATSVYPPATARRSAVVPTQAAWEAGRWEADAATEAEGWDDEEEWNELGDWDDDHEQRALALAQPAALTPRAAPSARQPALARAPRATQALLKRARSPWSLLRTSLALVAVALALGLGLAEAGEPSQPFMAFQARAESRTALNVAQAVKPLTSLKRPDQYDNPAQFALYSPAACSPSSMAEVLTAWGVPHATIGRMIDDLGPYLSPNWGLLDQEGFQVAAAKEGFRADIYWHLNYNQLLYLSNVAGLPVIVNFRRDWGYYHYFAGGHFLTVTAGDQQGVSIVDSSEYYITYLPRDVFLSLWQWRGDGTAQAVVLVPKDYQYTIPSA